MVGGAELIPARPSARPSVCRVASSSVRPSVRPSLAAGEYMTYDSDQYIQHISPTLARLPSPP